MPQELLRSAVPSSRSSRRWMMLPISVAAHGAIAVACFVIPLAAVGDLPIPGPPSGLVRFVTVTPPPPPPERRPAPQGPVAPPSRVAPTAAPPTIEPERPQPSSVLPGPQVDGALPADLGADGGLLTAPPLPPPPPQPVVEPPREPVRAGVGVREPRKIVDVAPVYPRLAQEARIQGVVVLEAVIGTDGRIDRLRVLRSAPLLDEAAIAAVKEWRYTPTQLNGVPVPVLITITINFRLH